MDTPTVIILVISTAAVLFFAVYFFVKMEKTPNSTRDRGRSDGTGKAINLMQRFALSNRYKFIKSVDLPGTDKPIHIDALVIGEFGILGVNAYGYDQQIFGDAKDKQWLRVGRQNSRTHFDNPIDEANRSVQALRKVVQKTKHKNVSIEVVCVFTSGKAQIGVKKGTGHLTMPELRNKIAKEKYQQENGVDIEQVEETIRAAMLQ